MAQSTRPGNTERGWNDPPEFLHSGGSAQPAANQRRTLLNKRVPFPGMVTGDGSHKPCTSRPLSGSGTPSLSKPPGTGTVHTAQRNTLPSASSAACVSTNTPSLPTQASGSSEVTSSTLPAAVQTGTSGVILFPPASSTDIPKFTAPIIVPAMSPKEESPLSNVVTIATNPVNNAQVNVVTTDKDLSIPDFDNDEQMYHFVLTRLRKTGVDCAHVVKPRIIDDINRKLDIFSKMWQDGKISYPVKTSMARLATALHKRKCDTAHEIHLALMMDFVSEVGPWMVGIKRLIHEARGIEPPTSPTDSTVLPPNSSTHSTVLPPTDTEVLPSDINNTSDNFAKLGLTNNGTVQNADISSGEICNANDSGTSENTVTSTDSDQQPLELLKDNSNHDSTDSGPAIIETTPITN